VFHPAKRRRFPRRGTRALRPEKGTSAILFSLHFHLPEKLGWVSRRQTSDYSSPKLSRPTNYFEFVRTVLERLNIWREWSRFCGEAERSIQPGFSSTDIRSFGPPGQVTSKPIYLSHLASSLSHEKWREKWEVNRGQAKGVLPGEQPRRVACMQARQQARGEVGFAPCCEMVEGLGIVRFLTFSPFSPSFLAFLPLHLT